MRQRILEIKVEPIGGEPFTINDRNKAYLQKQTRVDFQIEKQIGSAPASAYLDIFNIKELSKQIDFRHDVLGVNFGAKVTVSGGYRENGLVTVKRLFIGKVQSSNTSKRSPDYVTKLVLKNSWFELMKQKIDIEAKKGDPFSKTILEAVSQIEAEIGEGQKKKLDEILDGLKHEENETFNTTAQDFFNTFAGGLGRKIAIYWEDSGVAFTIPGLTKSEETPTIVSKIHGVPDILETGGFAFETDINGSLRINEPVLLQSEAVDRSSLSIGGVSGGQVGPKLENYFVTPTVIKKVIHSGSNWDGEFKTSAETITVREFNKILK